MNERDKGSFGNNMSRETLEALYVWGDPRGIAALPENVEYDAVRPAHAVPDLWTEDGDYVNLSDRFPLYGPDNWGHTIPRNGPIPSAE